jgi:uncharacterized protein (UPF0332 family)
MKPQEFAELAAILGVANGPFPGARARSSVSRFYYAAFLDARDQLASNRKLAFKGRDVHKHVRMSFAGAASGSDLEKIGRHLEDLKNLREDADYDLEKDCTSVEAAEAKTIYDAIVTRLSTADVSKCVDGEGRGR